MRLLRNSWMTSYRLRNNIFIHVLYSRKFKMQNSGKIQAFVRLLISCHFHLRKTLKSLLETEKVSFLKSSQLDSPMSRFIVGYPKQSNFNGRIYAPDTLSKIMKIMKSSIDDFVEDCKIITFLGRFWNISNSFFSISIVIVLSND